MLSIIVFAMSRVRIMAKYFSISAFDAGASAGFCWAKLADARKRQARSARSERFIDSLQCSTGAQSNPRVYIIGYCEKGYRSVRRIAGSLAQAALSQQLRLIFALDKSASIEAPSTHRDL